MHIKSSLYIVWGDANELGIPIIDEQHRGIISTINSLHYFVQAGHGQEVLKPTMIMLEQYTRVHFNTDVALLAEADYPAMEEHIGLHNRLVEKTRTLAIDVNKSEDSEIVLTFLKEWRLDHIGSEDRKFAPFLRKLVETEG